ncbi:MAG: hypothetical protein JG776_1070 [Caloramator sp.]|jgi:hypothetical protein|uniref:hypothetical protein n=1 Tax=Caloramator sp. TaxID=1871330 RepID=UPI001D3F69DC|nr:hypothetical protein [Caloramator sp.]MBZ4663368.1 hypothetical protein [Caloramator sp.]
MQYLIFPICILIGIILSYAMWKISKSIKFPFIFSILTVIFGVFLIIKAKTMPTEGFKDLAYVLNAIMLFLISIGMWIQLIIVKVRKK